MTILPEMSILYWYFYVKAVFRKGYLETPKGHVENIGYYGSYQVENSLNYPEKKCVYVPHLLPSPYLSLSLCSPQTATGQDDCKIITLYIVGNVMPLAKMLKCYFNAIPLASQRLS